MTNVETLRINADDERFPVKLRELANAPAALHVRGAIGAGGFRGPSAAIVGARAASGHGLATARELAGRLAAAGVAIVSGGAVGIDTAAHQGALDSDGRTIAVLASPVENPYPLRNRALFDQILARGGSLVSPFALGTPIERWRFPHRNRIIAALADVVVIVEASPASGTLHTAAAARALGRVLCACPGSPTTDALLAGGAGLARTAADVLDAMAGHPRHLSPPQPEQGSDEDRILAALHRNDAADPDELALVLGGPDGAVRAARALFSLELHGLALLVPGGRYVRSAIADRTSA